MSCSDGVIAPPKINLDNSLTDMHAQGGLNNHVRLLSSLSTALSAFKTFLRGCIHGL